MKMLFQTSIAFWSLPAPYRSQAQKMSYRFHWWNESRPARGQECLKRVSLISPVWSPCPRDSEVDEICQAFVKAHPKRFFQASASPVWLNRQVKRRQTTIVVAMYSLSLIRVPQIYSSEIKMRKMYIFKHNHNPYAPLASPIPLPLGRLHFIVTNPSLKKSWIRPWAVSEIHLKIPCGCMFITFYSVATSRSSFLDPVGALTLFSILSAGSADICFWQGQGSGQGSGRWPGKGTCGKIVIT